MRLVKSIFRARGSRHWVSHKRRSPQPSPYNSDDEGNDGEDEVASADGEDGEEEEYSGGEEGDKDDA